MIKIRPGDTYVNASYIDGTLFNSGTEDECIKYMMEHSGEMAAVMTIDHYYHPDNPRHKGHWSDCHGNNGIFNWS